MLQNIHLTVLRRLFFVSLFLVSSIGGGVYYFEMAQVDDTVLTLALQSASTLDRQQLTKGLQYDEQAIAQLQVFTDSLVRAHFYAVDIYDLHQAHLVASDKQENPVVSELLSLRHHKFPLDKSLHHEKFYIGDQLFMQVLIPVPQANDGALGYMEGVYRVDAATLAQIEHRIRYALTLVAIIVFVTSVALYPLILWLNRRLAQFSDELLRANLELLQVLGNAIALRDSCTNSHNYRVTLYCVKLAEKIGMKASAIRDLIVGAFLHDVGKIGIADSILHKPGKLSHHESMTMREHVTKGLGIVNNSQWLQGAKEVIAYHHEKYDGTGYAEGLKGESIPLSARVFAIADVFDALVSKRPYKDSLELNVVLEMLEQQSGKHFDPELLQNFLIIAENLYKTVARSSDEELSHQLSKAIYRYFFNKQGKDREQNVFSQLNNSEPLRSAASLNFSSLFR